jgi:putative ABC transport system permease protein
MFRNILKIVVRNLKRNLAYSFINIFGLGIGIAASFVILIYVQQELSYERDFSANEQVYRVGTKFMTMGRFANGPAILPHTLNADLPYIESSTSLNGTGDILLSIPGFEVTKAGLYVDSAFFKIFDYDFSFGSRNSALNDQNSIVISEKLADLLFGKLDAIGKLIALHDLEISPSPITFKVTGVVAVKNTKSHVNADYWAYQKDKKAESNDFADSWFSISKYHYVKLNDAVDPIRFQTDLDSLVSRHIFPSMGSNLSFEDWAKRDDSFLFIAQPINDIYLKSTLSFDLVSGGDETTVYVLLAIGLLIIVIACVNFINLTTARSINRAKEVGVKKSLGSSRGALITQFLIESITLSLIAMVFSMGFSELFLITFKYVTGQNLVMELFTTYSQLIWLLMLSLSIGSIAGLYPAFYLSGFKTSKVLKGGFETGKSKSSFRNALVVFQFFLSISLICLAWIVHSQLDLLKNKDLGFDQEHVLIIDNAEQLALNAAAFKAQLSQRAEVSSSAFFRRMPGSSSSFSISKLALSDDSESLKVNRFRGDVDFFKTLGFQLIEGTGFEKFNTPSDKKIILNEAAVKSLGLEDPVGTIFKNGKEVIGVVRDFNFENLRTNVSPAIIEIGTDGNIAFKLKNAHASEFIQYAENMWQSMSPDEGMSYHFLDENFGKMIAKEKVLSKAMGMFTILSILISCLGLYGLSSFMALQRKKEIGIRKVLGASVLKMWILLSKQFTMLILIATTMAIPTTIVIANSWLDGFVYRIGISAGVFITTGIGVLLIALLTVGYESIKAAISNPVESLKEE